MNKTDQRCWQEITWQDGVPYSTEFEDIYFSRKGGPQETEAVFLASNRFNERVNRNGRTTVCELGFGTGLNFLISWQAFRTHGAADARLDFISCDRFPLSPSALTEALRLYPELADLSAALMEHYPRQPFGHHRLLLDDGRVCLHLVLEEAEVMLRSLRAEVDAWYLDGFAPSRNPDMWTAEIYTHMRRLSSNDTTIGTFSAAGHVRRGLEEAGFRMERFEGAGNKRHNMRGYFDDEPSATATAPWYALPQTSAPRSVAVIGAGLAGTSVARELALRGCVVTLIDQGPEPASGASGNAWGLVMPMLNRKSVPQGQLALAAMQAIQQRLRHEDPHGLMMHCGLIDMATDPKDDYVAGDHAVGHLPDSFAAALDSEQLSAHADIPLDHDGFFYPDAMCVSPAELCRLNGSHSKINPLFNSRVTQMVRSASCWQLELDNGQSLDGFDSVIVANAGQATAIDQLSWIPIRHIRGQLSHVPTGPVSSGLHTALVHKGYMTPAADGQHVIGATFDVNNTSLDWSETDHVKLVDDCLAAIPALTPQRQDWLSAKQGRVGIRCVMPDQLPAIGPVPDYSAYLNVFDGLRKGQHWKDYPAGPMHSGLWMTIGHGSRGIMTTQFAAELLTAQLFQDPVTQSELELLLHPARFIVRSLKRDTALDKS